MTYDVDSEYKTDRTKLTMSIHCENKDCIHHYEEDNTCHQVMNWYIFRITASGMCESFKEKKLD